MNVPYLGAINYELIVFWRAIVSTSVVVESKSEVRSEDGSWIFDMIFTKTALFSDAYLNLDLGSSIFEGIRDMRIRRIIVKMVIDWIDYNISSCLHLNVIDYEI